MRFPFSTQKEVKPYRDVLRISLPLVVSMSSTMIMEFTDRIFLANYSLDAIAAALPAGITSFLFISFFMGTAQYLNVFVAQYTGSGTLHRVGAVLWPFPGGAGFRSYLFSGFVSGFGNTDHRNQPVLLF